MQWQDTDQFAYATPAPTLQLLPVTAADFAAKDSHPKWWVINGALSSTAPAIPAAQALASAKSAQVASLAQSYKTAIQQAVAYMTTTFQADDASQQTLTRCLVAGSVPSGFYWLDANNVKVAMTFAQLQGLAAAMLAQGQAAFDRLQTRKASVNAATDVATVQAIVW